jgi:hypothetical protein
MGELKGAAEQRKREKKSLILSEISGGLSISGACDLARISRETYYNWQATDEEFARDVQEARAYCEKYHVHQVVNSGDPKYSKWYLSILRPDVYGEKKALEMTVKQDDGSSGFQAMIEQTGGLFIESDQADESE